MDPRLIAIVKVMGALSDDEKAITDLTIAYAWALDTRRFEELRQVFAEDAVGDLLGVRSEGRDAITARISDALSTLDATQHVVSNHQVSVDGDTATCRCYLVGQHVKKGTPGGDTFIIAGTYQDELARTTDGWRITHRTLSAAWTDGNPAVVGREAR
jgi:ketosteroid isomerase-like protein